MNESRISAVKDLLHTLEQSFPHQAMIRAYFKVSETKDSYPVGTIYLIATRLYGSDPAVMVGRFSFADDGKIWEGVKSSYKWFGGWTDPELIEHLESRLEEDLPTGRPFVAFRTDVRYHAKVEADNERLLQFMVRIEGALERDNLYLPSQVLRTGTQQVEMSAKFIKRVMKGNELDSSTLSPWTAEAFKQLHKRVVSFRKGQNQNNAMRNANL